MRNARQSAAGMIQGNRLKFGTRNLAPHCASSTSASPARRRQRRPRKSQKKVVCTPNTPQTESESPPKPPRTLPRPFTPSLRYLMSSIRFLAALRFFRHSASSNCVLRNAHPRIKTWPVTIPPPSRGFQIAHRNELPRKIIRDDEETHK